MTTHTDRKSAEILAALDKLAENGMPFIDVVKQGGFAGFPAKGVQPLPTEPVQVHEDPGAAYWKEATKMAEHTDRIRQMAQEAKAYADSLDPSGQLAGREWIEWRDERFAQLVADDCARVCESRYAAERIKALANEGWSNDALAAYASCAEGLDIAIRARYSLKD